VRGRPRSAVAFAAAGLVVLAGCGEKRETTTGAASTAAPVTTLRVAETEFRLTPSAVKVPKAGVIQIDVSNKGKTTHALAIQAAGAPASTAPIAPGKTATLRANLKPGTYTWFCPIDGHRAKGMRGTIVIAGGSGSGGSGGGGGGGGGSSGGGGGGY
jgi:plastocyanin